MSALEELTVGEIVTDDFRTAGVFKKYGLDFCCGGKKKLSDACERKGLDLDLLLADIDRLSQKDTNEHNYKEWSPSFLVDYIINNHHHFVRRKLPEIKSYANKVAKVHGKSYPVLNEMLGTFLILKDEMLSHLDAEEKILFPYIKKMENAMAAGSKPLSNEDTGGSNNGTAAQAITMMEQEHDDAGNLMAKLEEMSEGFSAPEDACTTFRVYFQNLEAFRDDLHKHVHLENNILFPKALDMEKGFRNN
ncbi:MAG TPA: iron-sulfur cluster repair di-iron protein [Halalkalibaculum sp.]|nr:iron-sulfur cluster repair di-iron protein [Halalkalibaculum sp.]